MATIHDDHFCIIIVYSPSGHDIPYTRESPRLTPFCCYISGDTHWVLTWQIFRYDIRPVLFLLMWYRMLCGDVVLLSLFFLCVFHFGARKLCQGPFYGIVYVCTTVGWHLFCKLLYMRPGKILWNQWITFIHFLSFEYQYIIILYELC